MIEPSNGTEPESLTEALQAQVAFFKNEYETVKSEAEGILAENTELAKRLDRLNLKCADLETIRVSQESDKETVQSLRKQLVITEKERNSFESLWKSSQITIKNLENELKTYQTTKKTPFTYDQGNDIKYEFAAITKMLESKLAAANDEIKSKEDNTKLLIEEIENLKKKLVDKEKLLSDASEKQSESNIKIENLEKDICHLRDEVIVKKQSNEDVVNKLNICRQQMEIYSRKECEYRNKVAEALQLVDIAISEKTAAAEKEKLACSEAAKLSQQMTEVLKESTFRVEKELSIAKQAYNDKLNDMLIHIQRMELEMGEKNLALERADRECSILEQKIKSEQQSAANNKNDDSNDKILVLEQKLEGTFQQLLLTERRNIQIISEKENLQMDLEQMVNNFHRDKRKREWEEKLHLNEISSLKIQIGNLKEALNEAHLSIQKLQSHILSTEDLEEKLTQEKFVIAMEFEKYFETQQKLNYKWKESMKEMTAKLEAKVGELSVQLQELKKENISLKLGRPSC